MSDEDISLIRMVDHGLDLYGNVIIVNPEFAQANPDAVRAFVAVTVRGYLEDPRKTPLARSSTC